MKKKLSLLAVTLVLALGCTKEEFIPKKYPIVLTVNVADITREGVSFEGQVTYSSVEIIDHGFTWSESEDPTKSSNSVSLGSRTGIGSFDARCETGFKEGNVYNVWAYAKSSDYTVYGKPLSFVSQGSDRPLIKEFFPSEATWNETITIVGDNFSDNNNNIVFFGSTTATVLRHSKDTLMVTVPFVLADELSIISLAFGDNNINAENPFKLKKPIIESVTPSSALPGTNVIIKGKYLMSFLNEVTLGGSDVNLTYRSENRIEWIVPNIPNGTVTLKVVTGRGNLFTTTSFTVGP